jgi:hypothetical protein
VATYLSSGGAVLVQLGALQAELYEHLASDTGGRCRCCQEPEPCRRRSELHNELVRNGFLPRREPGRTYAGLVRRV